MIINDILYKEKSALSRYEEERCRLDLYIPDGIAEFPVMLWLHGGGMTEGSKDIQSVKDGGIYFSSKGIGVAIADYRLFPQVNYPEYIIDACDAFRWLCRNIDKYGGRRNKIFPAGHSAGAYMASIAGLSSEFLWSDPLKENIAGIIEISGQLDCHTTVKRERGIDMSLFLNNEAAPLYHVKADAPPFLCLYAEHDFPGREDVTLRFSSELSTHENNRVKVKKIKGVNHYSIMANILSGKNQAAGEIIAFIRDNV